MQAFLQITLWSKCHTQLLSKHLQQYLYITKHKPQATKSSFIIIIVLSQQVAIVSFAFLALNDIHKAWLLLGVACALLILPAWADSKQSVLSLLHVLGRSVIHGASVAFSFILPLASLWINSSTSTDRFPTSGFSFKVSNSCLY